MKYTLWNAEDRSREFPDTFEIPSEQDRLSLDTWDVAKVIFDVPGYMPERMWVHVTKRHDSHGVWYEGQIGNHPLRVALTEPNLAWPVEVACGNPVRFEPKHIVDLRKVDRTRTVNHEEPTR